jgi:SAM-dependent methyltransferase
LGANVLKAKRSEERTIEQLREHYVVERELARKLRMASKEERRHLYASVYDDLYLRVPHHPQNSRKANVTAQDEAKAAQMKLLQPFLKSGTTFMEIGSGDCSLSKEVATRVAKVFAIDVSKEIAKDTILPPNLELFLSDGSSIPVPRDSVDIAYSYQLMEHLHFEDACEQIRNIHLALAPGGYYICVTPNRLSGPHDISKYFDEVATGFHLKEYLTSELAEIFEKSGFSNLKSCIGIKGFYIRLPVFPITLIENAMMLLPCKLRRKIAKVFPFRSLLGTNLVGRK